jgi:hypothetical protein
MKIALIEIGQSHDECIYSQIACIASNSNAKVYLICSESLRERVSSYDLVEKIWFFPKFTKPTIFHYFKIWKLILSEKFDKVIFNTAQGKHPKNLLLFPYPKRIEFLGTLHNLEKLTKNSLGQRIISRKIKKYYLLNDYLLTQIEPEFKEKMHFGVFYPIFFPTQNSLSRIKPIDEIWICIPGQVELKRRDYEGLFQALETCKIDSKLKFILLGSCEHSHGDGGIIKKKIKELNLQDNFELYDGFVPMEEFYTIIKQSNYIMPLIHTNHVSAKLYKNQISGAFNQAFGYKIPFLLESCYKDSNDFKSNSLFYTLESLPQILNNIRQVTSSEMYSDEKWTFEYQSKKYWELINL